MHSISKLGELERRRSVNDEGLFPFGGELKTDTEWLSAMSKAQEDLAYWSQFLDSPKLGERLYAGQKIDEARYILDYLPRKLPDLFPLRRAQAAGAFILPGELVCGNDSRLHRKHRESKASGACSFKRVAKSGGEFEEDLGRLFVHRDRPYRDDYAKRLEKERFVDLQRRQKLENRNRNLREYFERHAKLSDVTRDASNEDSDDSQDSRWQADGRQQRIDRKREIEQEEIVRRVMDGAGVSRFWAVKALRRALQTLGTLSTIDARYQEAVRLAILWRTATGDP